MKFQSGDGTGVVEIFEAFCPPTRTPMVTHLGMDIRGSSQVEQRRPFPIKSTLPTGWSRAFPSVIVM